MNSAKLSNKKIAFEIILVIDSIEDSKEISDKIKKEYSQYKTDLNILINENNIGISESRNVGLKHSKYQYFTIIDQDDYVLDKYFNVIENKLSRLNSAYILNGYINYENHNKKFQSISLNQNLILRVF